MKKNIFIVSVLTIALLVSVTYVKAQDMEMSFMDKVAEIAGKMVGQELLEKYGIFQDDETAGGLADQINFNMQTGEFADATTTPFSVRNPFNATTTLDMMVYYQDGVATTTTVLTCGTSSVPWSDTANGGSVSNTLVDARVIATSTQDTMTNGTNESGTNSFSRIIVGPTDYVLCNVSTTADNASQWGASATSRNLAASLVRGVIGDSNTYDGQYTLEWFNWVK